MNILANADINTKIITGDNIFLGVQTAFSTGIINPSKTVIVVEGSNYNTITGGAEVLELSHNESGGIMEERRQIDNFVFSNNPDEVYAVDNDFIKLKPDNFMSDKVKVFARISP